MVVVQLVVVVAEIVSVYVYVLMRVRECVVVVVVVVSGDDGRGGVRDVNVFSFGSWFVLFLIFYSFSRWQQPRKKTTTVPCSAAPPPSL